MAESSRVNTGDDEFRRLADELADLAFPGPHEPDPPIDVDAALARFYRRLATNDFPLVDQEDLEGPKPTAARRSTTHWWRYGLAACLAVALALGFVWFLQQPRAEAASPPPLDFQLDIHHLDKDNSGAEASAKLNRLSQVALSQPATPAAGTVQSIDSYSWTLDTTIDKAGVHNTALVAKLRNLKVFPDGAVESTERNGPRYTTSGQLPPEPSHSIENAKPTTDLVPPGTVDPTMAQRLSTNPGQLRRQLLEPMAPTGPGNPASDALIHQIITLNDNYLISNSLAAAMWQVLAGQGDLHDGGTISDRLGNEVEAILYQAPSNITTALLIDPKTGALAGHETIEPNADPKHKKAQRLIISSLVAYLSRDWTNDPEPAAAPPPGEAAPSQATS